MRTIGNILWFFLGGLWLWLGWTLAGLLWCITIIGIPWGLQCFKFGRLVLWPFGRDVVWGGGGVSFLANLVWLLISGLPLALEHVVCGAVLCVTIVGIPFGLQSFKLAKLALMPFGAQIVRI